MYNNPMSLSDTQAVSPEVSQNTDRRGFVMTSLATGFALAVRPVSAQTITTDATGLMAGEFKIPVKDAAGSIPGYHAMPKEGKNLPVVIVVQEIFGVHEHIKDLCRRLAKAGYLAVAPELYARQGDVSNKPMPDIMKIVATVPDTQVMSDIDAAVASAKNMGGDTRKLAITGFCWGGRIVWLYSAHSKALKAGAAWYGRIEGAKTDLQPTHPIDLAAKLNAPVLGLYGGLDTGIPTDSVKKMEAAANAAKKTVDINIYPAAQHGFNADYRPSYKKDDAMDAWAKMLAHFKKYGV